MTVRITGVPFDQIIPEIQDALDTALAGTLNLQQGAAWRRANPKDTGRMASSWFIGHNTPRPDSRPEVNEGPNHRADKRLFRPVTQTYEQEEYSGKGLPLTGLGISATTFHTLNTSPTTSWARCA